jgi:hypothetical protein
VDLTPLILLDLKNIWFRNAVVLGMGWCGLRFQVILGVTRIGSMWYVGRGDEWRVQPPVAVIVGNKIARYVRIWKAQIYDEIKYESIGWEYTEIMYKHFPYFISHFKWKAGCWSGLSFQMSVGQLLFYFMFAIFILDTPGAEWSVHLQIVWDSEGKGKFKKIFSRLV